MEVQGRRCVLVRVILTLVLAASSASSQVTADFTATPTSGTNPVEVSFAGTIDGATPLAWTWMFGDGATGVGQAIAHTYTMPGTFDVTLTVLTSVGGISVVTVEKREFISVSPAPLAADFTWTPTTGVNPVIVEFTDTTTGSPPTSWSWTFGDGAKSTEQHPTHVYDTPGVYDVTLEVFFGEQKAVAAQREAVTVHPAVIAADFTSDVGVGTSPLVVTFTDASTGPIDAWLWDFGDGATSTSANPTHTYTTPGVYDVGLIVAFGGQLEMLTKAEWITVLPAPLDVDFTASTVQGPNPLAVTFMDTTTGGAVDAWLWQFGDDPRATSTDQHPTHTFGTAGVHTVTLTVFLGGQSATLVKTDFITVDAAPLTADFSVDATSGTNPLLVSFADTSLGGLMDAWLWDFGDGASSTAQNPMHLYDTPGTYDVSLTVMLGRQSEAVTKDALITVLPAQLIPNFTADPITGVVPHTVAFTNESTAHASTVIRWDFGDGELSFDSDPVHIYTAPGIYSVTLTLSLGGQQAEAVVVENLIHVRDLTVCEEAAKLVDENGAENGEFGRKVVIDGDRAVVWSPVNATLNVLDVPSMSVVRTIVLEDEAQFVQGLALQGELIAVGAPVVAEGEGAVLFFDAATGSLVSSLMLLDTSVDMGFGAALSLDGDRLLVSTTATAAFVEQVYLYDISDLLAPALLSTLVPDEFVPYGFGVDLALYGNRAFVGTNESGLEFGVGSVWLYDVTEPRAPVLIMKDTVGGNDGYSFGYAVGLSDGVAVSGEAGGVGSVRVYDAETGDALETIDDPSSTLNARFGEDVVIDGSHLLIGSRRLGGLYAEIGGAYIYDLEASEFTTQLRASDADVLDEFGVRVGLSGDVALVAAVHDDDVAQDAGAVYRFDLLEPSWVDLGQALPGIVGPPSLVGGGVLETGCTVDLVLTDAAPFAPTMLVVGMENVSQPVHGGTLVPSLDVRLGLVADGHGRVVLTEEVPPGFPAKTTLYFQAWIIDPSGPQGLAASNGLEGSSN